MIFCTVILNGRSRTFSCHIFKLRIRRYEKTVNSAYSFTCVCFHYFIQKFILQTSVWLHTSWRHLVFPIPYVLWIEFILLCQQEEMLEKLKYCQLCPQSSVMYIHAILLQIQLNIITTDILKVLPDQVLAVKNNCLFLKNLKLIG